MQYDDFTGDILRRADAVLDLRLRADELRARVFAAYGLDLRALPTTGRGTTITPAIVLPGDICRTLRLAREIREQHGHI